MKRRRRILLVLSILLALATTAGTGGWFYRATPSWYPTEQPDPQQLRIAGNQADQTLLDVVSWAAQVQAREMRHRRDPSDLEPPIPAKTVTFNNSQINAFLGAWQEGPVEGRIILADGEIILASYSASLHTIVSLQLDAGVDEQGMIQLRLGHVGAGRLWLPRWIVGGLLSRNERRLESRLSQFQPLANIDQTDTVNNAAAACVANRILLDALNDRSSDPYVCLPYDLGNIRHMIPAKLTGITVGADSLTTTFQPLSNDEQKNLLARIKSPYTAAQ